MKLHQPPNSWVMKIGTTCEMFHDKMYISSHITPCWFIGSQTPLKLMLVSKFALSFNLWFKHNEEKGEGGLCLTAFNLNCELELFTKPYTAIIINLGPCYPIPGVSTQNSTSPLSHSWDTNLDRSRGFFLKKNLGCQLKPFDWSWGSGILGELMIYPLGLNYEAQPRSVWAVCSQDPRMTSLSWDSGILDQK